MTIMQSRRGPFHLSFHERKKDRTEYFNRFVYGWKLVACISCNGSGWYDSWDEENDCGIPCESCDGTGRTRFKLKEQDDDQNK